MKGRDTQAFVVVVLLVLAIGCMVGVATGRIQLPVTNTEQGTRR